MKYIDIHTHGGFGVNFNNCSKDDILNFAQLAEKRNIVGFLPTLATDEIKKITNQIEKIIEAKDEQKNGAKIIGIHLEACFLNPEKSGIHKKEYFLEPNVENWEKIFKKYEKDIKIVTLAPELDENNKLQKYLISKGIKVQAGHTMAEDAGLCDGITHMFNAMPPLSHKKDNITSQALVDNNIFVEFIGDLIHTTKNMAKLLFGIKDKSKIMLVSDSLPIAHSGLDEIEFCNHKVFKNGKGEGGELAGSVKFLDEIAQNLINKKIITEADADKMCYENQLKYLDLKGI